MKLKFIIFLFCLIANVSCIQDKSYPERLDLNNHIIDHEVWNYQRSAIAQLLEIAQMDSTKYSDIFMLHKSTNALIEYIDNLEETMVTASGGVTENNLYINPNIVQPIHTLMIDEGIASELKLKIDDYTNELQKYGLSNNQIAIEPIHYLILKHDPNYKKMTFEQLHFENTSLVESIYALQLYKLLILIKEGLTINLLLIKNNAP